MSLEIRNRYDELHLKSIQQTIDDLKFQQKEGWQEKAVKIIKSSRLDVSELELKRLRFFNILTKETEAKLDHAISTMDNPHKTELKIMIAQALEIQKIYQETHHVFIHAQDSGWLLFPDLVKELTKIHHPEQDLHQFKFLRMPDLHRSWDITHYCKNHFVHDHDTATRTDLISADGHFFHNTYGESSLYFLSCNRSMETSSLLTFQNVIQHFYPKIPLEDTENYARKMMQETTTTAAKTGNLFVICIPKEKSASIQYRAHSYGVPCTCHPDSESLHILESLQKQEALPLDTQCENLRLDPCPQFRLFAPELKKENGVKIYMIPPDRLQRKAFKQNIKKIISEISQSSSKK